MGGAEPATVHGTYNYWLGGSQHLIADRELGSAIRAEFPGVPAHVRAAEGFHRRFARHAAAEGISAFLRAGPVTWLPGARNLHEAAREVNPAARCVYVNMHPAAHEWAQDLLADGDGTAAALGDLRDPAGILAGPEVTELLAPGAPAALLIGMAMHFAPAEVAAARIAAWAKGLPPGSLLAVSLVLPDDSPEAARLTSMFTPAPIRRHTADDVAAWLAGAGLDVIPPGARDVRRLLPGRVRAAGEAPARAPGIIAGALGRVPRA